MAGNTSANRPDPMDNDELRQRILDIVSEQGVIEKEKLVGTATLDELGVQSIDMVMILNEIEEAFGIYVPIDQSVADVKNLDDFVDHIAKLVRNPPQDPFQPAGAEDTSGAS